MSDGIFKGLQFKYPEVDVTTIQTLRTFKIRSLTVQEEEQLKSSLISPSLLGNHVYKILFGAITECDDKNVIKDFDTFIENVTQLDRETLMFYLYLISYGADYTIGDYKCEKCSKSFDGTVINLEDFKEEKKLEGPVGSILSKRIVITLPISKARVTLKIPTLKDEIALEKVKEQDRGLTLDAVRIDFFEVITEDKKSKDSVEKFDSIIDKKIMYKSLCARDRKFLDKEFEKNFLNEKFFVKPELTCACGFKNSFYINVLQELFRMAH